MGFGLDPWGTGPWGGIASPAEAPTTPPTTPTAGFCAALALSGNRPVVILTIEGMGTTAGLYRFCSRVPDYAASNALYLPWLASWPELVEQRIDPLGGAVELGELEVSILDGSPADPDRLSVLLGFDRAATTRLTVAATAADTLWFVASTAAITPPVRLYCGSECVLCTAKGVANVTVQRAFLDSNALPHAIDDDIFLEPPFPRDRIVRVRLSFDGLTGADELEIASYLLDDAQLDLAMNAWRIRAVSTLGLLDRPIFRGRGATGRVIQAGAQRQSDRLLLRAELSTPPWPKAAVYGNGTPDHFLRIGSEVVRVRYVSGDDWRTDLWLFEVAAADRQRAGSQREPALDNLEPGQPKDLDLPLTEVFVADRDLREAPGVVPSGGSYFRTQAPGAEASSLADAGWTLSDHPVDVLLCVLTSPADPSDGLSGTNYVTGKGNWSFLPGGNSASQGVRTAGVGAGIQASAIDFDSFAQVKREQPEWRMAGLVMGERQLRLREWLDGVLKSLGWYLVDRRGKIRLVAPRSFTTKEPAQASLGTSNLLAEAGGLPQVSQRVAMGDLPRSVQITIRTAAGDERAVTFNDATFPRLFQQAAFLREASSIELDATWLLEGKGDDLLFGRGASLLARVRKPVVTFSVRVHADLLCDVAIGDRVTLTFSQAFNGQLGARGVTSLICGVIEHRLRIGEHGLELELGLVAYAYAAGRVVGPAARVASSAVIGSEYDVTCAANRYTVGSGAGGVPVRDVLGFAIGDKLRLQTRLGVAIGGIQTVVMVQPGGAANVLRLDGNFGGGLAVGTVLRLADYDDSIAAQKTTYGYQADSTNLTLGASSDAALRWAED